MNLILKRRQLMPHAALLRIDMNAVETSAYGFPMVDPSQGEVLKNGSIVTSVPTLFSGEVAVSIHGTACTPFLEVQRADPELQPLEWQRAGVLYNVESRDLEVLSDGFYEPGLAWWRVRLGFASAPQIAGSYAIVTLQGEAVIDAEASIVASVETALGPMQLRRPFVGISGRDVAANTFEASSVRSNVITAAFSVASRGSTIVLQAFDQFGKPMGAAESLAVPK